MPKLRLAFKVLLGLALFVCFLAIANHASADTHNWLVGGSGAASTGANWDLGTAPAGADDVVMNTGSNACTWDLALTFNSFTINGYSGTITQSATLSCSNTFTFNSGTWTGSTSYFINCLGTLTCGTSNDFGANTRIQFSNTAAATLEAGDTINRMTILSGTRTVSLTSSGIFSVSTTLTTAASSYLSISNTYTIQIGTGSTNPTYTNSGGIQGEGTLIYQRTNAATVTFGTVSTNLKIQLSSSASASRAITLGGAITSLKNLTILSNHASNILTLANGGFAVTCRNITLSTRCTFSGSGALTCNIFCQSGTTSTFTQGANTIVNGDVFKSAGTLTGSTSYTFTVSGNFNHNAGTITTSVLKLTMTGATKTLKFTSTPTLHTLTINGNTAVSSSFNIINTLATANSIVFTINSPAVVTVTDITLTNLGSLAGTGTFDYARSGSGATVSFGTINCPTIIQLPSGATGSRIVTLGAAASFGSSLVIKSDAVAYTCTVACGGYNLAASTIDVQTRGYLTGNSGGITAAVTVSAGYLQQSGSLVITGSLTISGGTVTQSDTFTVSGDVSISTGTLTGSISYNFICSGSFSSSGGVTTLLRLSMGGTGKSLSPGAGSASFYSITVTGGSVTFNSGTYTVTNGVSVTGGSLTQSAAITLPDMTVNGGTLLQANTLTITGDTTLTTGTLTGSASYYYITSGSFAHNGGTLTPSVLNLAMQGTGKTLTLTGAPALRNLMVNGTTTSATSFSLVNALTVNAALTINTPAILTLSDSILSNSGGIGGTGGLTYARAASDATVTFGTVSCNVIVQAASGAASSRIVTLGADTIFGGTLTVQSAHGSYTMTVTGVTGNRQLTVSGLATIGTRGIVTQGTGLWTFSSGLTLSGASAAINQGGDLTVVGDYTQSDGTLTGVTTSYTFTVSGNFIKSSGTIVQDTVKLRLTGTSKSITSDAEDVLRRIWVSGTITLTSGTFDAYDLQIDGSGQLTISSSKTVKNLVTGSNWAYSNSGTIDGAGELIFLITSKSVSISLGTVSLPMKLELAASSTSSVISLGAAWSPGSTLTILSDHASNTITLDHGTNYQLTVTGLTTLGARGIMSQGSGTWAFTGGYTQNGASSSFTQGGAVTVGADFTLSSGSWSGLGTTSLTVSGSFTANGGSTITSNTVRLVMTGTSKALSASGYMFKSIKVDSGSTVSLGTNVMAKDIFIVDGALTQGSYRVNVSSSYTNALYVNGTFNGMICLNGSALAYAAKVPMPMVGSVQATVPTTLNLPATYTFIFTPSDLTNISVSIWDKATGDWFYYSRCDVGSSLLSITATGLNFTKDYYLYVDGSSDAGPFTSTGAGQLTWSWSGAWSGHEFNLSEEAGGADAYIHTWAAASDGYANVAGNWDPAYVPAIGDSVIFDGMSDYNCNWNLANALDSFSMNTGYDGTVTSSSSLTATTITLDDGTLICGGTITGNIGITGGAFQQSGALTLTGAYSMSSGSTLGDSTNWLTVTGSFIHSGGTLSSGTLKLKLIGSGYSLQSTPAAVFRDLFFQSGCSITMTTASKVSKTLTIDGTVDQGGYYLYVTSDVERAAFLNGTYNGPIKFDGAATKHYAYIDLPMTGTIYINKEMHFIFEHYFNVTDTDGAWVNFTAKEWEDDPHTFWANCGVSDANVTFEGTGFEIDVAYSLYVDDILFRDNLWSDSYGRLSFWYDGPWSTHFFKAKDPDTHTWSAAIDGAASVAGNWNPSSVPDVGDSVIFDATSIKNCTWDLSVALYQFSMNSGYTQRVSVSTAFTASYKVTLNAGKMEIVTSCTAIGALSVNNIKLWINSTIGSGTGNTYSQTGGATIATAAMNFTTFTINGGTFNQNAVLDCDGATFTSGTFTQNAILWVNGTVLINGGTFTGPSNWDKLLVLSGSLEHTSGTFTAGTAIFRLTANNKYANLTGSPSLCGFRASGTPITVNGNLITTNQFVVDTDVTVNINNIIYAYTNGIMATATSTWQGPGRVEIIDTTNAITFGSFNIPLVVRVSSSASGSKSVYIGTDTTLGSTLSVYSEHASYTCEFSHASNRLLTVSGLVTLGIRGKLTQGTGTWTFNGGYTQNGVGSEITLGAVDNTWTGNVNITAGTYSEYLGKWLKITNGYFNQTGGTVTNGYIDILTDGKFIYSSTGIMYGIRATGNLTIKSSITMDAIYAENYILTGKTISIDSGCTLTRPQYGSQWVIYGIGKIIGSGTLKFSMRDADYAFSYMDKVYCNLIIETSASATRDCTWPLGSSMTYPCSSLTIQSLHASYKMTLTHGSDYQLSVSGAVILGTRGRMTQGTGVWTFNAGYTQNGITALMTQGANILVTGDVHLTDGGWTVSPSSDTKRLNISGNLISSITYLADINLVMYSDGTRIRSESAAYSQNLCALRIQGNVEVDFNITVSNSYAWSGLYVNSGKTLTIATGIYVKLICESSAAGKLENYGTITGGTLRVQIADDSTRTFGTVNSAVQVQLNPGGIPAKTLTLGTNTVLGSTLLVQSEQTSHVILNLGGYSLSATVITISTRGTITTSVNGANITCTSIYLNNTNPVLTQAAGMGLSITANLYLNAGYINQTGNIFLNGNYLQTTGTGTFTGAGGSTYWFVCSGSLTKWAGSMPDNVLRLKKTGTGNIALNSVYLRSFWVAPSATPTLTDSLSVSYHLNVEGTLSIQSIYSLTWDSWLGGAGAYSNTGSISGGYSFTIRFANSVSRTLTLGSINTPLFINLVGSSADVTLTLENTATLPKKITIYSSDASYFMVLDLNGKSLTASNAVLGSKGKITTSVNGANLTCTGLYLNDTNPALTQTAGMGLTINGNVYFNAGTVTQLGNIFLNGNYGQSGARVIGSRSYRMIVSGYFNATSGTMDDQMLSLKMTGNGKSLMKFVSASLYKFELTGNLTLKTALSVYPETGSSGSYIYAGATLTMVSGQWFWPYVSANGIFSNEGTITGPGGLCIYIKDINMNFPGGAITCSEFILCGVAFSASRTVTMTVDANIYTKLRIDGSILSGANKMVLDLHGCTLITTNSVLIDSRAVLTNSINGGNLTCSGLYLNNTGPCLTQAAGMGLTINNDLFINAGYVNQSGNMFLNGNAITSGGTINGDSTNWFVISGNMTYSSGTWNAGTVKIRMTGTGKTLTSSHAVQMNEFRISADVIISSNGAQPEVCKLTVDSGKILTIATGKTLRVRMWNGAGYDIANSGSIIGPGILQLSLYDVDRTFNTGTIIAPTDIYLDSSAAAGRSLSLGANCILGSTLNVASGHAVNKVTLNLAGFNLNCTSLTIGVRGILSCAGTERITLSGDWDSSGTSAQVLPASSTLNMTGATNSIKMLVGQYLYNLETPSGTVSSMLSHVVINNHYKCIGTLTMSSYNITINGTSTSPLEANGTFSGSILITSSTPACTVYVKNNMTGTVHAKKNVTFIFPAGRLAMAQLTAHWVNVTIKDWAQSGGFYGRWWAGSNTSGAVIIFSFKASPSTTYAVSFDGLFLCNVLTNSTGYGIFTKTGGWSGHEFELTKPPVFLTIPVTEAQVGFGYFYDSTTNEEGAGTYAVNTNSADLSIEVNSGLVYGMVKDRIYFCWVNITFTSTAGFTANQNYTITIGIGAWNHHVMINAKEAGYFRVQFSFNTTNEAFMSLIAEASWNFGDGKGSKDFTPVHKYEKQGKYMVTVSIKDLDGHVGSSTREITVGNLTNPEHYRWEWFSWWTTTQGITLVIVLLAGIGTALLYSNYSRKRHGPNAFVVVGIVMATALFAIIIIQGGIFG